jgi:hypothetical protein
MGGLRRGPHRGRRSLAADSWRSHERRSEILEAVAHVVGDQAAGALVRLATFVMTRSVRLAARVLEHMH